VDVNNKTKIFTRQAYGDRDKACFVLKRLFHHQARIKLVGLARGGEYRLVCAGLGWQTGLSMSTQPGR
jgi:hypothetical protein